MRNKTGVVPRIVHGHVLGGSMVEGVACIGSGNSCVQVSRPIDPSISTVVHVPGGGGATQYICYSEYLPATTLLLLAE